MRLNVLDKVRQRYHKNVTTLASALRPLPIRNPWPDNVRELGNAIERAVMAR